MVTRPVRETRRKLGLASTGRRASRPSGFAVVYEEIGLGESPRASDRGRLEIESMSRSVGLSRPSGGMAKTFGRHFFFFPQSYWSAICFLDETHDEGTRGNPTRE